MHISSWLDVDKVRDVVDRLVNPLDNALNEKCSRIKAAFAAHMGFAAAVQPDLIVSLLGGKFAGALLGLIFAMRMTSPHAKQDIPM